VHSVSTDPWLALNPFTGVGAVASSLILIQSETDRVRRIVLPGRSPVHYRSTLVVHLNSQTGTTLEKISVFAVGPYGRLQHFDLRL